MDRNNAGALPFDEENVALRKESVDRNWPAMILPQSRLPSLSARRAWIEISIGSGNAGKVRASLSARRAWIEIELR